MSEINEKSAPPAEVASDHSEQHEVQLDVPNTWKYRQLTIFGKKMPFYASPEVQLFLVAMVCFMCPGMYNALTGMGGGGQIDAHAGNDAAVALYSTFAVVGFSAGSICNRIGIKATLCIGGLGYSLYVASFLCYNHTQNYGFTVFAGTMLGVCAGLLWCAQGTIMMSYPPERSKGKFISWFWMIFNLGAVIGGLIPLGLNFHRTEPESVNDATYIGFLILTIIGALLTWTLVASKDVVRSDGTKVIMMLNPTWWSEIKGMGQVFVTDPYIIALFPMFFASNWFYTYHFNDFNLARFNLRTRALNSVLYYSAQIVGAYIFGYMLDMPRFRRTTRAKFGWVAIFVYTVIIWSVGYTWQKGYTRADTAVVEGEPDPFTYDWSTDGYVGGMLLYMFYGGYDAAWQITVYWMMGSLSNNSRKLANFAGFYKGIQSAGAAITWSMDNQGIPYLNMWASNFGLLAGSLIVALPVLLWKIKDQVDIEQDLKFTDETLDDVIVTSDPPPHYKDVSV